MMRRYITSQYLLAAFVLILAVGCTTVQMKLYNASLVGDNGTVKTLLAEGVDINAGGYGGATPLMAASQSGHANTVKVLLAAGADINAKSDALNMTALSIAINNGHKEIIALLKAAGATE